ncbi:MAG: excinuclease ABC subunit UvrA [Paludibacteraceae bacterium]|nr:excinuclease ABC subunit UvrA [Paludibacteraceae bacterium]
MGKKDAHKPTEGSEKEIRVIGARVHNLKNISVSIPRYRLSVITGLSGSGKSSLAFDTIFAEGQRRYLETFSSYARGYIGTMQRPDVDQITGLSPVISIDQKTTSKNPRSTVGTITEVYDFLRLLYARAGEAYSYLTGEKMVKYTDQQILELIQREYAGKKILLLSPLVNNRKGHYKELFETIRKKGYVQVRVDGEVQELVPGMKLDRYKNHTIEVVIDKLKVESGSASGVENEEQDLRRMRQSVDKAMEQGDGLLMIADIEGKTRYLSRSLMCPTTGLAYRDPAPHTFSFNSPSGWCECCKGLGRVRSSSVSPTPTNQDVEDIIQQDDWFEKLRQLSGIELEEDTDETQTEWTVCPECEGKRLSKESLSYKIGPYTIHDMSSMDIDVLLETLQTISPQLTERQQAIAAPILKEICGRLRFMQAVGLSYLSLGRPSDSLSGGESQRIRLATQIGSRLVNVLYILDEPSIGLHQRDNQRLISSLKELRDLGNSVIVVEHDEQIMREADWIVDIGPKAGRLGGKVLFSGTPEEMLRTDTLTAQYLRGEKSAVADLGLQHSGASGHTDKPQPTEEQKWLTLSGCTGNNLQDVMVRIPLGQMVGVTGVSGSGKSTLINQTLYPILSQHFYRSLKKPLAYREIEGLEEIDKVINVDQSPIGRSPRSNPATYTNVFNDIRDLFAQMPESRMRGWKPGRFSFNMRGGRCEECKGNGFKTIQMHFMPDVFVPCEACNGRRYNKETLEVRFKGKSIGEILDMTVNQAVEFFENQPTILRKIKTIQNVGLGYIKLGQPSTTLSGGESQRIKLATELSRPSTGRTLYILDEPTTGLHFEDIRVLNGVLRQLVDRGNTVVVIEHNLDVIRACDWLIDLGPEGGRGGGRIVAEGTPEDVKQCKDSVTGKFL